MGGSPLGDAAVSASWNGPKAITCSTCERKIKRLFLVWVRLMESYAGSIPVQSTNGLGMVLPYTGKASSILVASTQGTAVLPFFSLLGATNLTHEASRAAPRSSWGILLFFCFSFPFAFPFPANYPLTDLELQITRVSGS